MSGTPTKLDTIRDRIGAAIAAVIRKNIVDNEDALILAREARGGMTCDGFVSIAHQSIDVGVCVHFAIVAADRQTIKAHEEEILEDDNG